MVCWLPQYWTLLVAYRLRLLCFSFCLYFNFWSCAVGLLAKLMISILIKFFSSSAVYQSKTITTKKSTAIERQISIKLMADSACCALITSFVAVGRRPACRSLQVLTRQRLMT